MARFFLVAKLAACSSSSIPGAIMRAVVAHRYGPPEVLRVDQVPEPACGEEDVLVRIVASAITQGDRRMRAADFGGLFTLPGRLFFGVIGPRFRVPGSTFAGHIESVGERVDGFRVGDPVFGLSLHGAHAERLRMRAGGAIAPMPVGIDAVEAASLAYGAATALWFLRHVARVHEGEHVVVVGAGGGVGRSAVQVARALGARVTAICSGRYHALVRDLGAACVVPPDTASVGWAAGPVDVVFDVSGVASFRRWSARMTPRGRMVATDTTLSRLLQAAICSLGSGPKLHLGLVPDRRDLLDEVAAMVADGNLRPVVAATFPLEDVVAAHHYLASHKPLGDVVVTPL